MAGNDGQVTIQVDTNAGSAAKQFDAFNEAIKRSEQEVKTAKAALDAHNASMKFLGNTSQGMKDMQGYLAISYNQSKMALANNRLELEKFKQAQQNISNSTNEMREGFSKITSSILNLKTVIIGAVGAFALLKLKSLAQDAINTAAEFEQLGVSFEIMAGGKRAGDELLSTLINLANVTPMTAQGLARNAQTLLAFGEASQNVVSDLKVLGDIAGGNQERMNSLVLAFSQVGSTGRLMGQDLLQMVNVGFNPLQIMSEKTGKSMATLKKEMADGKIAFSDVKQAMIDATSEGGRFFGMMEKQSQTLTGRLSSLEDAWSQLLRTMGNMVLSDGKYVTAWFTEVVNSTNELINRWNVAHEAINNLNFDQTQIKLAQLRVEIEKTEKTWTGFGKSSAWADKQEKLIRLNEEYTKTQVQLTKLSKEQKASIQELNAGFKDSSDASDKDKKSKEKQATEYDKLIQKVNKLKDALLMMSIRGQEGTKAFSDGKEALTQYTLQIEKANKAVEVYTGAYDAFQAKVEQAQENLQNIAAADVVDIEKFRQAKQEATDLQIRLEAINRALQIDTSPYDALNTKIADLKRQLQDLAVSGQAGTPAFTALKNQYVVATNQMEAANRAVTNAMGVDWSNIASSIRSDLASAITTPLREGENAFQRFGNVALNIISMIGQKMIENLLTQISLEQVLLGIKTASKAIGGFFGFADGAAFKNGKVIPFASGGIVNQTTAFPMSGGKTGVMGEAGAEAIMPLKRTSDGRLGVEATGAATNVNVYNQSQSQIETIKRPNGDVDLFIRRVNSALASERTNNGFARASQRQQPRGIQAV